MVPQCFILLCSCVYGLQPYGHLNKLVGCFGYNGPLRYSSLYRAVSQREGERGERIDESKKCPNQPLPHLLQAQ